MSSKHIIRCCHCGAEYLPAEIFYPNDFLGKPRNIEKDFNGKLINYLGLNMNTTETYYCDYCGKRFKVDANIKFYVDSKVKNYKNTYKTKLSKPSLFMKED